MSIEKQVQTRAKRRALRVRSDIARKSTLPRVTIFRSLKYIYAQLIDDAAHKTVASCSSLELKDSASGDKKAIAHSVGVELAKRAKKNGVEAAVFDRGQFLYHGRVKALAEGLREGGLQV